MLAAMATVFVLHGLGRSPMAMLPLVWALRRAGHAPVNLGYVAARRSIEATAARLAARIARLRAEAGAAGDGGPVAFVTQSLGGLLARQLLASWPAPPPGEVVRLVQLAPPNQGARLADVVRGSVAPARWVLGRALEDLGTHAGAPRHGLPPLPPWVEAGVVAGGTGGARGFGRWLEDDNDGVVRVAETWLPEARDWILLPRLHTFVMNARDAQANALRFLEAGRFLDDAPRLAREPDGRVRLVAPAAAPAAQPAPG